VKDYKPAHRVVVSNEIMSAFQYHRTNSNNNYSSSSSSNSSNSSRNIDGKQINK